MYTLIKVFWESMSQALQSLSANKMRTFLSLLGIVIGIFCIIAVKSAVDSLQDNIISGFNELGSDVVYIDKMPWNEDPGQNWWKYQRRPNPSFEDYQALVDRSKLAEYASYIVFSGGKTLKHKSNSISGAVVMGSTYDFNEIQGLDIEKGRYFTRSEYNQGTNKIILGYAVAQELFGILEPVGKNIRLFGQKFQVIGVLKSEGDNMFNFMNFDDVCWVSYTNIKKFVNTRENNRAIGRMLQAKAYAGVDLQDLKGEITGVMRAKRRLKPAEGDNFSINEISMIAGVLEEVFGVLNIAGFIIGFFALLVGMFSVANIMFVSVKERTNIIGIKKAIGAKRHIILLEFLIEAVILCMLGGLLGLAIVFLVLKGLSSVIPFDMYLSFSNMATGVGVSIFVGIIAGIIPAVIASKMNPVEAIRA